MRVRFICFPFSLSAPEDAPLLSCAGRTSAVRGGRRTRTLAQAVYSRGDQPVACPRDDSLEPQNEKAARG